MKTNAKAISPPGKDSGKSGLAGTLLYIRQHWQLYVIFMLPAVALTIIFRYIPMGGFSLPLRITIRFRVF